MIKAIGVNKPKYKRNIITLERIAPTNSPDLTQIRYTLLNKHGRRSDKK